MHKLKLQRKTKLYPREIKFFTALFALFSISGFWILLCLNGLVGVANWGINGWLPTYLKEHFHLGLGKADLSATGYIQVASFIGVLVGGAWADRWSRKNLRGRTFIPAIGYCVAGPFLFLSAMTNTLPVAIMGLMVFGLGRGFFDGITCRFCGNSLMSATVRQVTVC